MENFLGFFLAFSAIVIILLIMFAPSPTILRQKAYASKPLSEDERESMIWDIIEKFHNEDDFNAECAEKSIVFRSFEERDSVYDKWRKEWYDFYRMRTDNEIKSLWHNFCIQ